MNHRVVAGPYGDIAPKGWTPGILAAPFLVILIGLIGLNLGALPAVLAGLIRPSSPFMQSIGFVLYHHFLMFGAAAALFVGWTLLIERRGLGSIGLIARGAAWRFTRGFMLALAMLAVVMAGIHIAGGIEVVSIAPAWRDPVQLGLVAIVFLSFVVQGSAEEIAFRGWIVSAIAYRSGVKAAIVVSCVVFTISHSINSWPPNPLGLLNIFLAGLLLCLMSVAEGSILGACGWHAGWNWALGTGFQIPVSTRELPIKAWVADVDPIGPEIISGGQWGPEASLINIGVLALACAAFAVGLAVRKRPSVVSGGT